MDVACRTHAGEVAEWDAYVAKHPGETNDHQSGWKSIVERGGGLYAEGGQKIVGFWPLVMMKSLLVGRCAVSMPFLSYGGMLAEATRAVIEEQTSHMEFQPPPPWPWTCQSDIHKGDMILGLVDSVEAQWKSLMRRSVVRFEKRERRIYKSRVVVSTVLMIFMLCSARICEILERLSTDRVF